jgi:predicted nucleic acid-binding Zn ribbon protein
VSDRQPRRVGDSLDRVANHLGAPSSAAVEAIFSRWTELVGDSVAAHARPRSLREGVLVVAVEDPAWATQLRFLESDLLRRLTDAVGDGRLTRIEVRVAPA